MIIVKIKGGLGNQMFQYAYYRSLSKIHRDVKMDIISYFEVCDLFVNFELKYELNRIFGIPCGSYATVKEIERLSQYKNLRAYLASIRLRYMIKNAIKVCRSFLREDNNISPHKSLETSKKGKSVKQVLKSLIVPLYKYIIFNNSSKTGNHFIENVCKFNTNYIYDEDIYYEGYWQNINYFDGVLNEIQDDFTFKNPLNGKNKKFIQMILKQQWCPISIHIRRNDYVDSRYNVLTHRYYEMAIEEIEKLVENPVYIIFSDDIEWVKKNLPVLNDKKMFYVDWNKGDESYRDMQLMSYCKHNIIANSTFSWWGAFLNKNKSKIIVSPSIFYRTSSFIRKRISFPSETKVVVIDNL